MFMIFMANPASATVLIQLAMDDRAFCIFDNPKYSVLTLLFRKLQLSIFSSSVLRDTSTYVYFGLFH
jgi:hypothetical protein